MDDFLHILSRGVDKRNIFLDKQDYLRFIHDMYLFNDDRRINSSSYQFGKNLKSSNDFAVRFIEPQPRDLLVNIHMFCLMKNHYHLLLSQLKEGGLIKFIKKLNMGYAKYFNQKYKRVGTLYERRYRSVVVGNEKHFNYLPFYIHLNPLDFYMPSWREMKIQNHKKALDYLEDYRWSSHLDYLGRENFPSVTQRSFFSDYYEGSEGYRKSLTDYLRDLDLDEIRDLTLE